MRFPLTITLPPFPVCSQWPGQEEVANVFLLESLLNRDGSMSPSRHTVGIKEHLTMVCLHDTTLCPRVEPTVPQKCHMRAFLQFKTEHAT